jgi:hypothetical protein
VGIDETREHNAPNGIYCPLRTELALDFIS